MYSEKNVERISITLPKECISWIDRSVESRVYANRSHAIECCLLQLMKDEHKRAEELCAWMSAYGMDLSDEWKDILQNKLFRALLASALRSCKL